MKMVSIPPEAAEVNCLLDQARHEDLLPRASDGTECLVSLVDDFDNELAGTRLNAKLMAVLEARVQQAQTVPLDEVKRQLGLGR